MEDMRIDDTTDNQVVDNVDKEKKQEKVNKHVKKTSVNKPYRSFKEVLFELDNLKKYQHSPKVNLYERNNSYVIYVELAGVSESDITVQLRGKQFFLISGNKFNPLYDKSEYKAVYSEFRHGYFMRRVKVPSFVDKDTITTSMSDGVLIVTVEKLNSELVDKTKEIDFDNLKDVKDTNWADEE